MKLKKFTIEKKYINIALLVSLFVVNITSLASCTQGANTLSESEFAHTRSFNQELYAEPQSTPMYSDVYSVIPTETSPPNELQQRMVFAYGELFWVWVTPDEGNEVLTWLKNHPFSPPPSILYRKGYCIWDWGFVWETPDASSTAEHNLAYHELSGRWRNAGPPSAPPPHEEGVINWDTDKWTYTDKNGWVHPGTREAERMAEFNYAMVIHGRMPVISIEGFSGRANAHIIRGMCPEGCYRNHDDDLIYIDGNTYINVYSDNTGDTVIGLLRIFSPGRVIYFNDEE